MPRIVHSDFYSHILGLSLKVEVTGHSGHPVLMFPTSYGQYTQNADFHLNSCISKFTDSGRLTLYNIQTLDTKTFYAKDLHPSQQIHNYELYVRFLIEEFIPFLQKKHRTHRIATAGASFGGYHASNLAFRVPDLISHLFSLSGSYSIRNFMKGYNNSLVYFNCPEEFVENDEAWRYKHMNIVLSTSDWDICLEPTRKMAGILKSKGIDCWYDEAKWIKHDWPLWRMVFPKFIEAYFG